MIPLTAHGRWGKLNLRYSTMKLPLLFATLLASSLSATAQTNYSVTISPKTTYQTIQDFGASDCWTADFVGKYFNDEQKSNAAQWLFSREFDSDGNPLGIGLSMWRVNLGAGSAEQGENSGIADVTRRGYCYLDADGNYDWTKSAGQQYFMQKAKDYGVDHFLLFSNSAPVQFTKNGKACADNGVSGSNLKDDCYGKFADFLTTTASHFIDEGYNITLIDPVNEPQYSWTSGQEGSPWTNECIAKLARQLNESIESKDLNAQILLPEACQWKALYMDGTEARANNQIEAFFNPANTSTYIGDLAHLRKAIAGHSYWTFGTNNDLKDIRQNVYNKAQEYGLDVYQTEWSMLDAAPSSSAGFPASYDAASYIDIAIYMAKLIHCDLTYGNMSSWHYWTSMAQQQYSQKNRFYLLRIKGGGDTDTSNESYSDCNSVSDNYADISQGGAVSDNANLWALGNYSLFIRPGYKRVKLDLSEGENLNGLMGSAYVSPDGKRLVAVYVNMGSNNVNVTMNVDGQTAASSFKRYRTSSTNKLKYIKSSTANLGKIISLPSKSINTFVMDFDEPICDGIDHVYDDAKAVNDNIYTLDGQLVRHNTTNTEGLPKGIYIMNGKKFIVK